MKTLRYVTVIALLLGVIAGVIYLLKVPEAIFPFLNPFLMLAMPVALGIYLARRFKVEWHLFFVGMLTFVGSQVLHIPFNAFVIKPVEVNSGWEFAAGSLQLALIALVYGLSAGLFEETARYIVYRRWLPQARRWRDGLMFGAGHGGVEAMITGALVLISFLGFLVARNADPVTLTAEQLAAVQQYWSLSWYDYLLGALERFSVICFHLSAALLVLQAVVRNNIWWYVAALLWHAALDFVAVFASQTWGAYVTEAILLAMALVSLGVVFALRKTDELPGAPPDAAPPPELTPAALGPEEVTAEKLEDSRYD
ncbi:MAG: YhfC family intramembrane metalloprotease [Anaerolineales bacterium]|nr:YhfC family intramembrane metalloprotease [Anaerolineales bacterium]